MTCSVPLGSVLGLLLWNIAFNNILKEDVPLQVNIICCANDTLVVTAEDNIPMLEWKVNTSLEAMTCWIESAVSSVRLPSPKVRGDKALYSPEVFGFVVRWKADFQGACQKETAAKVERTVAKIVGSCRINHGVTRISVSCWRTLPYWSSYMKPQSGLTPSTSRHTEEQRWFQSNGRMF